LFGPPGQAANQLLGLGRKKYLPDEVPDDITIISNIVDAEGKPLGALGDGEAFWHTDSSFTEKPISASLLHAIEVTEQGGETAFLNMYKAYEEMPAGLAARIEGKYANHSKLHNSAGMRRPEFADVTDPSKAPGVKHPMVRVHPVTARKCLYLGRRLNSYIFGLSLDESEVLLDELWAHTCQDKYVWQHKWRVGDLIVWDNRCTMHHRNAFAPNARRLMHKSTSAGEAIVEMTGP
jgi:taurine dioxygenase